MNDPIILFKDAIAAAGLPIPPELIADGRLHRFPTNGKADDDAGWYVLHLDGVPAGSFGCWRSGISETWSAKTDQEMTAAERGRHRAVLKALKRQRDAEEKQRHEEVARKAAAIWDKAEKAPDDHPYLAAKGIKPYGIKIGDWPQRDKSNCLLIPLRDNEGALQNLQAIFPSKDETLGRNKDFLFGGVKKGCYFTIGELGPVLGIVEGYATAASIHEATGLPVAVAFDAGNLKLVALALHKAYPNATLLLCADNDQWTEGNPGLTKASEAAKVVKARVVVPDFTGLDLSGKPTDFNDLARLAGLDAVCQQIENALRSERKQASDKPDWSAILQDLAKLSPLDYDRQIKEIAKQWRVRERTLHKEVKKVRGQYHAKQTPETSTVVCPDLGTDDILLTVNRVIKDVGYGGDARLPLLLYLSYTTRLLLFRKGNMLAHGQVVGAPSSGKNYAVDTVLALLPGNAYLKIDAGSPKALIYTDEDLRHRIVVFVEADSLPISEGAKSLADGDSRSTAASALRNLASDGHLSYDIVERDPETGRFVTRHIVKDGPTLLITTTTKAIGGQMGTRLWEVPMLETDDQVKSVLAERVLLELGRERRRYENLIQYQAYLQSKAPWDAIVPFARELKDGLVYQGMNPRITRDFERLLSLIKAATILRHPHRKQDANDRWIATLDDYEAVRHVLNDAYAATVSHGLTDDVRQTVNAVKALKDAGEITVTYDKVAAKLNAYAMKVYRKIKVALQHGWLVNQQIKPRQPADLIVGSPMPDRRGLPLRKAVEKAFHSST